LLKTQIRAIRSSRRRGLPIAIALVIVACLTVGIGLAVHRDASATSSVTRSSIASLAGGQVGNDCSPYAGACSQDWCAIFAEWVWSTAGVSDVPTSHVATDLGTWGQQRGLFKDRPAGQIGNPLPGDLVIFGEPGSGVGGHVAVVETVNSDGTITTINGNYNGTSPTTSHVVRTTINPITATSGARGVPISGYVSPPGVSDGSAAQPVCRAVMGNWDGANGDSLGVACHGATQWNWNLMNANMGGTPQITSGYGNSNSCLPVTGDWNGDGRDTVGTACKSGAGMTWNLIDSLSGGSPTYQFGFGNSNSCEPVTGDFNNDRRTTIGVACRGGSGMSWQLMNILAGGSPQITAGFGNGGFYQPVSTSWYGPGWPGWPY
jgi:CHAP domain